MTAMVLPTAAALLYFLYLGSSAAAGPVYAITKIVQFALPLLAIDLWWKTNRRSWSRARSVAWGLASGGLAATAVAVAFWLLAGSELLTRIGREVAEKTAAFSVDSPARFVLLALFLSLAHSGLEEYYWRGFVYGGLERWLGARAAWIVSSVAFTAHHVVIVGRFAASAGEPVLVFTLTVAASLGVLVGGLAWSWLYTKSGSLLAPWVSHVLADLAVMAVGYRLLWV